MQRCLDKQTSFSPSWSGWFPPGLWFLLPIPPLWPGWGYFSAFVTSPLWRCTRPHSSQIRGSSLSHWQKMKSIMIGTIIIFLCVCVCVWAYILYVRPCSPVEKQTVPRATLSCWCSRRCLYQTSWRLEDRSVTFSKQSTIIFVSYSWPFKCFKPSRHCYNRLD